MRPLSGVGSFITRSRRTVTVTAFIVLFVVGFTKLFVVRAVLRMGVPREVLQAQDAIITGTLAAALAWVLLIVVHARRQHQEEQIRVVADLHHHLRNALEVILASEYLRESDKAPAILESVERIDNKLTALLPPLKIPK